jgi:hypothetical protein
MKFKERENPFDILGETGSPEYDKTYKQWRDWEADNRQLETYKVLIEIEAYNESDMREQVDMIGCEAREIEWWTQLTDNNGENK